MASILGVSSIYQTPSLKLYKRTIACTTPQTNPPSSSLAFPDRSNFNSVLRACNTTSTSTDTKAASRHGLGLVSSAIATPNSVLSEEAFKGLGDFSEASLDDSDDNEDYASEDEPSSASNSAELAVSKLGLPQRLVDSLHGRGITDLFPIQVTFFSLHFSSIFLFVYLFNFFPFFLGKFCLLEG